MKILSAITVFAAALVPVEANKPNRQTATVQLSNDQTGAWANVDVPEDGSRHSVANLWRNTAVAKGGHVSATSAQFNKFQQNTVCAIWQQHPHVDVTLNAQRSWVSLAGGKVVDLQRATISCWTT